MRMLNLYSKASNMQNCSRFLHNRSKLSIPAVALDIDGVLIRGGMVLPSTKKALERLKTQNIPFILLTNGGGVDEKTKARRLSSAIGTKIDEKQVILAHTPLRTMLKKSPLIRDGMSLIIGPESCKGVALKYGFKQPVLPDELLSWDFSIWPFKRPPQTASMFSDADPTEKPFSSIVVFHDSRDWGRDIQIICDILRSENGYLGSLSQFHHTPQFKQSVPMFFTNPDFQWANDFPLPRLAQGAFQMALNSLYHKITGNHIEITEHYGKPFKPTYDYAAEVLAELTGHNRWPQIYAIGDNVASDIVGANLAGWHSILVRTGVWKDEDAQKDIENYHLPPNLSQAHSKSALKALVEPKTIMDDVGDAVDFILRNEGLL